MALDSAMVEVRVACRWDSESYPEEPDNKEEEIAVVGDQARIGEQKINSPGAHDHGKTEFSNSRLTIGPRTSIPSRSAVMIKPVPMGLDSYPHKGVP